MGRRAGGQVGGQSDILFYSRNGEGGFGGIGYSGTHNVFFLWPMLLSVIFVMIGSRAEC